jgi:hypothetical protein
MVTALAMGATPGKVMEALELTSVLGVYAINVGVLLLTEVLVEEGWRGEEEGWRGKREGRERGRGIWGPG